GDLTPTRGRGSAVGPENDVRVEYRDQRVEVAGARRGQEGIDNLSLAGEIGVGGRRSPHPAACAAGQLSRRGRGPPDDGSDLVERQGEQVVQYETGPLGGAPRVAYHSRVH